MYYRALNYWPHIVVLLFVLAGILEPEGVIATVQNTSGWFMHHFNWLILLSSTGFLGICIYLCVSRYGHIRLGRDDENPRYNTLSWLAMLFAAGMGAGLVFYGAAEPLFHYHKPPPYAKYNADTMQAARQAMVITHFHWTLHAWAIYCISALTIAYFAFRKNAPLLPSSPIVHGKTGEHARHTMIIVNGLALLAVVYGVVASLANGIENIKEGLEISTGFEIPQIGNVVILVVLTICFLISAMTKISQGIKVLSNINLLLCLGLMLFIIFAGPTSFIIKTAMASLGDYLQQLLFLSFSTRHYGGAGGEEWTQQWTLSYFLWWIAWGPFVGVFIARISQGRTIREFVLGVILIPSVFSVLWFSAFGGAGIYLDAHTGTELGAIALNDAQAATYRLLEHFPLASIMQALATLLMFIFLITSADSGSYVLGMFASEGNPQPPKKQRFFWGIIISVLTLGALFSGRTLELTKSIAAFGAIPFLIIILVQIRYLLKALKAENIHVTISTNKDTPAS